MRSVGGGILSIPRGLPSAWDNLKIGGGGYCTGLDIAPDGTMVTRVDVHAAYIGNTAPGTVWRNLVTTTSMPAAIITATSPQYPYIGGGVKEIRIAPSNSNVLYMIYQHALNGVASTSSVFVSTNKGLSWTLTSLANFTTNPNDNQYEYYGQNIAIDPVKPNICYVGTPSAGLWFTTDTGATWTQVSTGNVPNPTAGTGYFGMAFDTTSGVTAGGATKRLMVPVFGVGFYQTTDGGATWGAVTGAPTAIAHGKVGIDGTYYCTSPLLGDVYRLTTGLVWKDIMLASSFRGAATIACDPANKDHLVVGTQGTYLNISSNATVTTPTWSGVDASNNGNGQTQANAGAHFVTANDVPWIQNSQDFYLSDGDVWFDPNTAGKLWMSYGCGVLYATAIIDPPTSAQQQWVSQIAGIENIVVNYISWPPGGAPVLACWDRPFFRISNVNAYPANYGPNYITAVQFGSSVDYATLTPSFMVGIVSQTPASLGVFSTDGGVTWQNMTGTIPGASGANNGAGTICAVDTTHFVVARSDNQGMFNTTDGGATWGASTGAPTSGWGSSGFNSNAHVMTKDLVNTSTLYAYNETTPGLWISTNKGANWSLQFSGHISGNDGFLAKIKAVPLNAGHLFFTAGQTEDLGTPNPHGQLFYRSTNAGVSWPSVANVQDVIAFGFSAPMPGGSGYPAILINGWVSQDSGVTYTYGFWRSDDNCVSWTKMGDFLPRPSISSGGWIDDVTCIEGSPNFWNRWIVGFQGSSACYFGPGGI